MLIHRHAAAIVGDFERAVLENRDVEFLALAGKCLVDTVIDDFVCEVVWPGGIGVHARPAPNRFESAEDLNVRRVVFFTHQSDSQLSDCQKDARRNSSLNGWPTHPGGTLSW